MDIKQSRELSRQAQILLGQKLIAEAEGKDFPMDDIDERIGKDLPRKRLRTLMTAMEAGLVSLEGAVREYRYDLEELGLVQPRTKPQ